LKKLIATLVSRFCHFLFVEFGARRAARHFRFHVPGLGMVENEKLVLASQSRTSGLVFVSGFMIPRLEYELFVATKDGWEPKKISVLVGKDGQLERETDEGLEALSYRDPLAAPIIEILKATYPVFPFTHYNISTQEQLEARTPSLKDPHALAPQVQATPECP
jgi:hypothetical protein